MKIPMLKLADGGTIPQLGLGTWQLNGETCTKAVDEALNLGYTHIDTADIYGNHKEIGKAISSHERESFFLTSKIWHSNLQGKDVLKRAERFLHV